MVKMTQIKIICINIIGQTKIHYVFSIFAWWHAHAYTYEQLFQNTPRILKITFIIMADWFLFWYKCTGSDHWETIYLIVAQILRKEIISPPEEKSINIDINVTL